MKPITRRAAIVTGLASAGGFLLTRKLGELPPTYGHILRMADNVTYAAHRVLLPGQSLAREYGHGDISSFPAIGTTSPADVGRPAETLAERLERPGGRQQRRQRREVRQSVTGAGASLGRCRARRSSRLPGLRPVAGLGASRVLDLGVDRADVEVDDSVVRRRRVARGEVASDVLRDPAIPPAPAT